jgi:hypothetical protein
VGNTPALADLVSRVTVTAQGSDAVLTLEIPASLVPAVFNSFQKPSAPKPIA